MQRSFRSRPDRNRSNITRRRAIIAIILVSLIAAATRIAYLLIFKGYSWPEGTGFGEKTLWDWLDLLIIPAMLGFGALWFNQAAHVREQRIAADQQREAALQNYLDKMEELLLREMLLEKKNNPEDPIVDVAQVRTVTTLRILDTGRKNILFQFLRDANLADFILSAASLAGADLSGTKMVDIDLREANLSAAFLVRADLSGASLHETHLSDADLSAAHLVGADLRGAKLDGADLRATMLNGANLSGANLVLADLSGAFLTGANLSRASLYEANMNGAILNGANLNRANLIGAKLRGAQLIEADTGPVDLSKAKLRETDLSRANFGGANLRGADLSGANLSGVNLSGARYDSQTKWPEAFDHVNSGAILGDE